MTREQKQEALRAWLLSNPANLKTNHTRISSRFHLSFEDVKDIVNEVRNDLKFRKAKAPIEYPNQDISKMLEYAISEVNNRDNRIEQLKRELSLLEMYKTGTTVTASLDTAPREFRTLPAPFTKGNPNNVLVIGDTHIPFERDGYLEHCRKVQEDYNCGTVIHIGDVIDNNYSSYHETNPDGHSAGDELQMAIDKLKDWYYTFPNVKVCLGNHDQIIQRKAFTTGLSKRWIRGLNEVLQVPNWEFDLEHHIDDVIYTHGTGTSSDRAAFQRALNRRRSIVSGHLHTTASITWNVSDMDRIFAMNVGCGIDDAQYSFDYAKTFSKKSIVSCGVVLNKGKIPIIIPMEL